MKYNEIKTKKAKIQFVKTKLESDDKWLLRGLVAIYKRQTDSEKNTATTKEQNGVGFSAFDAEFLTIMAQLVIDSKRMSIKQIDAIRKAMKKYADQLVRIAG